MIDFGNYSALFSSLFIFISTVCFILKLKATINLNRGVSNFYFFYWQKAFLSVKWTVKWIGSTIEKRNGTFLTNALDPRFFFFCYFLYFHRIISRITCIKFYNSPFDIIAQLKLPSYYQSLNCHVLLFFFLLRETPPYVNSNIYSHLSVYLIEDDCFYLFNANAIKLSMAFFSSSTVFVSLSSSLSSSFVFSFWVKWEMNENLVVSFDM